jgi:hypothetical protein
MQGVLGETGCVVTAAAVLPQPRLLGLAGTIGLAESGRVAAACLLQIGCNSRSKLLLLAWPPQPAACSRCSTAAAAAAARGPRTAPAAHLNHVCVSFHCSISLSRRL